MFVYLLMLTFFQSVTDQDKEVWLLIDKSEHRLMVYCGNKQALSFKVALGQGSIEAKEEQGDMRTPEGSYYICDKHISSSYYKVLQISYPNTDDAYRGLRSGLITRRQAIRIVRAIERGIMPPQQTRLGNYICIHGGGNIKEDWTWGCIALKNKDIDYLYEICSLGMKVVIRR